MWRARAMGRLPPATGRAVIIDGTPSPAKCSFTRKGRRRQGVRALGQPQPATASASAGRKPAVDMPQLAESECRNRPAGLIIADHAQEEERVSASSSARATSRPRSTSAPTRSRRPETRRSAGAPSTRPARFARCSRRRSGLSARSPIPMVTEVGLGGHARYKEVQPLSASGAKQPTSTRWPAAGHHGGGSACRPRSMPAGRPAAAISSMPAAAMRRRALCRPARGLVSGRSRSIGPVKACCWSRCRALASVMAALDRQARHALCATCLLASSIQQSQRSNAVWRARNRRGRRQMVYDVKLAASNAAQPISGYLQARKSFRGLRALRPAPAQWWHRTAWLRGGRSGSNATC